MTDLECPRCSHRNALGANFCSACGLSFGSTPSETKAVPVFHAAGEPTEPLLLEDRHQSGPLGTLVVARGPNVGARITLSVGVTTLGRHPDSVIFLDDITVSRRHAEIRVEGGIHEIRDAGSLNGTYVNRQRIEQAVLSSGDEVQVGKFKLVFVTREAGSV